MPWRFKALGFTGPALLAPKKPVPQQPYDEKELVHLQMIADSRLHWVVRAAGNWLLGFLVAAFVILAALCAILYPTSIQTVGVLPGLLTAVFLIITVGGVFAVLGAYFDRRAQNCLLASLTPQAAPGTAHPREGPSP